MPHKFFAGIAIGAALTLGVSFYVFKPKVYHHPNLKITEDINWTSVENIENSLKDKPAMHVGFDIDDTALFPRTAFHVAFQEHCPDDEREFKHSCSAKQEFWDQMNTSGHLCPPKKIAIELINMHKKRGDKIHFITAREKSKNTPETLTQTLKQVFGLPDLDPVVFLGWTSITNPDKPGKTKTIKEKNIKIFYGDSDADISAAVEAGVRGIRVIRAANSQDNANKTMPLNGRYGEEVIVGSDL